MTNFKTLVNSLPVVRETEKAVCVKIIRNNAWLVEDSMDGTVQIWLPKSQVQIVDAAVVAASDWIIRSKKEENSASLCGHKSWLAFDPSALSTVEDVQRGEAALEAGKSRYDALVAKAKAAGLPVRNRMKTSTIMTIAAKHGVSL